jgi:hypothetical protein
MPFDEGATSRVVSEILLGIVVVCHTCPGGKRKCRDLADKMGCAFDVGTERILGIERRFHLGIIRAILDWSRFS